MDKTKTATVSLSRKYQLIRVKRKARKMMTAEKADRFRRIGLIK
jgi:hypothetical protein